jgi:hypothetical protein
MAVWRYISTLILAFCVVLDASGAPLVHVRISFLFFKPSSAFLTARIG